MWTGDHHFIILPTLHSFLEMDGKNDTSCWGSNPGQTILLGGFKIWVQSYLGSIIPRFNLVGSIMSRFNEPGFNKPRFNEPGFSKPGTRKKIQKPGFFKLLFQAVSLVFDAGSLLSAYPSLLLDSQAQIVPVR